MQNNTNKLYSPEPIAIVGLACIFPDAKNSQEFFTNITNRHSAIKKVRTERLGLSPDLLAGRPGEEDKNYNPYAGTIDFTVDLTPFQKKIPNIEQLDPYFHWTLHLCKEALADAGINHHQPENLAKTGLILGNLTFSTETAQEIYEDIFATLISREYLGRQGTKPAWQIPQRENALNLHHSAMPARLAANFFGLGLDSYALDAACASSLFVLERCCNCLHNFSADTMLAVGVNRAEMVALQVGFSQLNAQSKKGVCEPFGAGADGLVVGEGGGALVLKRLSDALQNGDRIYGLVRGIGLSGDGREGGMLAPGKNGQIRALQNALNKTKLSPDDIDWIECHGTATPVGDKTEVESLKAVYGQSKHKIGIGSIKSMVGHCLSAAGMASLIKMILSLHHKKTAPTIFQSPSENIGLQDSPFYLIKKAETWQTAQTPKRAGVSGFGFGGTNAHVILEEYINSAQCQKLICGPELTSAPKTAILSMDCELGSCQNIDEFLHSLHEGRPIFSNRPYNRWPAWMSEFLADNKSGPEAAWLHEQTVGIKDFHMRPREVERLLPQQLLILKIAKRVLEQAEQNGYKLNPARTGVIIGLNQHSNITDNTLRLKAPRLLDKVGHLSHIPKEELLNSDLLSVLKKQICAPVNADDVLGNIPNFPANRISAEFDLQGPSYVVFQEENSSMKALETAISMLANNEADAMIVGAVDLPLDYKYVLANPAVLNLPLAEGAGAMLICRHDEKQPAIAIIEDISRHRESELLPFLRSNIPNNTELLLETATPMLFSALSGEKQADFSSIATIFGYGRSMHGIMAVIAATLRLKNNFLPARDGRSRPWLKDRNTGAKKVIVHEKSVSEPHCLVQLVSASNTQDSRQDEPRKIDKIIAVQTKKKIAFFAAAHQNELCQKLQNKENPFQPAKTTDQSFASIVFTNFEELQRKKNHMLEKLRQQPQKDYLDPSGAWYFHKPLGAKGKLAFVYPGFGNLYADMSRHLLQIFPSLAAEMENWSEYANTLSLHQRLHANPKLDLFDLSVFEISFATTFFSTIMTKILQDILKIQPQAVIGFSGGEINCLSALGIWQVDEYYRKAHQDRVFSEELAGEFLAAQKFYQNQDKIRWQSMLVAASEEELQEKVQKFPHLAICMVNSPKECFVAGYAEECADFARQYPYHCLKIPIPQIYHHPILKLCEKELKSLWTNQVQALANTDMYAHAAGQKYQQNSDSVSAAILRTACEKVYFTPLVENAWQDGVRIFVETGPGNSVCRHIDEILKNREYFNVALNIGKADEESCLLKGIAALAAHGVPIDLQAFQLVVPITGPQLKLNPGRQLAEFDLIKLADLINNTTKPAAQIAQTTPVMQTAPITQTTPVTQTAQMTTSILRLPTQGVKMSSTADSYLQLQNKLTELHRNFLSFQQQLMTVESQLNHTGITDPITTSAIQTPAQTTPAITAPTIATPAIIPPTDGKKTFFDYNDCLSFAHGKISDVFGPEFEIINAYPYRTRFPSPPYLFVSRMMDLTSKVHEFKNSSVASEFDVPENAWFLVDGRVPICVAIESGQADLFLISHIGIDFEVKGERVYRLLGANFTVFGDMPKAPCTLRYEITAKSFVKHEGIWLFFFDGHGYADGRKFIQWIDGCAGYFSFEELNAKQSFQYTEPSLKEQRFFHPIRECRKNIFHRAELEHLVHGRIFECFGYGFETPFPSANPQHRFFPQFSNPDLLMIDEMQINRTGGSYGLGYLKAKLTLDDQHWYFTSHFVTDNVLPGTLMLYGCAQLLEFYLLYLGFGFQARNARFNPLSQNEIKVKCRGQVVPGMRDLSYFVDVKEINAGVNPYIIADILVTSEGREVVSIQNLAWGIIFDSLPALPKPQESGYDIFGRPVPVNEAQLIELTTGKPSRFFGKHYEIFDEKRRISRMPNPPYAAISRVTELKGDKRNLKTRPSMTCEFDVQSDDWYFTTHGILPFCVINEILLQPCGLICQLLENDMLSESDRFIRNLGGHMISHEILRPQNNRIITQVQLKSVVETTEVLLIKLDGQCYTADGNLIVEGTDLHFGFFSQDSLLSNTTGIVMKEQDKVKLAEMRQKTSLIPTSELPTPDMLGTRLKLPKFPGLYFDRIVEFRPQGGSAGLGYIKVEKDVNPAEWIFYAHFYMDPVVPGSYSLDACMQVLEYYLLYHRLDETSGQQNPYFAPNHQKWMNWIYKGQILQSNSIITYEVEITDLIQGTEPCATGHARVYVDGRFIYEIFDFSVKIA